MSGNRRVLISRGRLSSLGTSQNYGNLEGIKNQIETTGVFSPRVSLSRIASYNIGQHVIHLGIKCIWLPLLENIFNYIQHQCVILIFILFKHFAPNVSVMSFFIIAITLQMHTCANNRCYAPPTNHFPALSDQRWQRYKVNWSMGQIYSHAEI